MRKNQYNQVDTDFDLRVLFLGTAFGNHQGKGNKGVVSDVLGVIAKRTVLRKRINEIVRILLKYYV